MENMESVLERKSSATDVGKWPGTRRLRDVCSSHPAGSSCWTLQAIADELLRLEPVDSNTDSTICNVIKQWNQAMACKGVVYPKGRSRIYGSNGRCSWNILTTVWPAPACGLNWWNKQLIKEGRILREPGILKKLIPYIRDEVADVSMISKLLPDMESFKEKIRIGKIQRNAECKKINWQFKTADATIKLARLYPIAL